MCPLICAYDEIKMLSNNSTYMFPVMDHLALDPYRGRFGLLFHVCALINQGGGKKEMINVNDVM